MRRFALLLFTCLALLPCFAVTVSGTAKGFENKYIRMYAVSDVISRSLVKLDVVKIDANGQFELNGYLNQTSLIKLKIEDKTLDLLVFPNFNLEIELEYDEELNLGRLFDKQLFVEVLNLSDQGINDLLFKYQQDYAGFLADNQTNIVTKKMLPQVRAFEVEMKGKYNVVPLYFKQYLEYDLAALEDAVLGSETKLYQNQLHNRSILYSNIAYMNFFKQFFQERFVQISQGKEGFQMLSAVNGTQDYQKLLEIVKNHPYIDNDTTAQLFMIMGLQEVYTDETFKKDKVLSMLNSVKLEAVNRENKRIAENVIDELTYLKRGQEAPEFSLQDQYGSVHHLDELKGKPVLLFFWSVGLNVCLRDMSLIKEFNQKYNYGMAFVAINMDDKTNKALKFSEENQLDFLLLYKDLQYDVIDKYRVYGLPMYVLIDAEGKIVSCPAKRPEANLESDLNKLISENGKQ